MTSIDILMDKIAELEHADAIQNSKIKQLEIECDSLRSMLKRWTKPMSDWNTPEEDEAWKHLQEIGEQMQEVGVFYGMVNNARRTTKTTATERRKNVGCYNGAPQTVRTSYN